jgi:hypothetical protein
MISMRFRSLVIVAILVLVLAQTAGAKGLLDKNLHYFQPTIDGSGMIVTYGSEPLGMFRMYYGAFGDVAINMLKYDQPPEIKKFNDKNPPPLDNLTSANLIKNQIAVNAVWGIGFWETFNVGLAVPFVVSRSFDDMFTDPYPSPKQNTHKAGIEGDNIGEDTKKAALEDIRLDIKVIAFNRLARCIGTGVVTTVGFPLAYQENQFVSDAGVTVAPRWFFDIGRERWTAAINVGYKYYSEKSTATLPGLVQEYGHHHSDDYRVRDELLFNLGAKFRFSYGSEFVIDSAARTFADNPLGDKREDYMEIMGAYRKYFRGLNFTALTFGGGVGLNKDAVGSPMGRVFIGITRDEKRLYVMSY